MPGIGLGGLLSGVGGGLGQWAQYQQQQQNQQRQQAMLMMALQQFRQQQQLQQQQQQASAAAWPAMLGAAQGAPGGGMAGMGAGMGGGVPPVPQPQQMPPLPPPPPPPQAAPADTVQAPPSDTDNPEVATNNFAGMRQPGAPAAGGPRANPAGWQQFPTPEAGVAGISSQLDRYASGATTGKPLTTLRQIVSTWAPPNENPTAQLIASASKITGYAPDQPLDLKNPEVKAKVTEALIRNEQGGKLPIDQATIARGIAGGGQGANPIAKEAQQTAQKAQQITDPSVYGRMALQGLARQIEKANPDADPMVKMMALEQASKLLAPSAQQEWQLFMLQNRQDMQLMMKQMQIDAANQRAADAGQRGGPVLETDQGPMRVPPDSNKAVPIDIGGAHVIGAKGGEMKPENILAFKGDEKVFEGTARHTPEGWINDATGKPIDADRIELVKGGTGAGSAGRAGAQVQRQLISAREVLSDLQNVVRMPITSDRGIFGGRTQGPGLFDALKENLAESITSEDAELTNSALSSLARELSIVVSPVYGGHWAADSFNALALKEGQTNLVKLYNIGRMRQTVDNALEGVINTDWVGAEQKKYAQSMLADLAKAIPWTPADVLAFREQSDNRESFSDFVKKQHVGSAGGGQPQGPQPGEVQQGYRFKGGDPADQANWERSQ